MYVWVLLKPCTSDHPSHLWLFFSLSLLWLGPSVQGSSVIQWWISQPKTSQHCGYLHLQHWLRSQWREHQNLSEWWDLEWVTSNLWRWEILKLLYWGLLCTHSYLLRVSSLRTQWIYQLCHWYKVWFCSHLQLWQWTHTLWIGHYNLSSQWELGDPSSMWWWKLEHRTNPYRHRYLEMRN